MIAALLIAYTNWLFAGVTLYWMASILYRTTRDTLNADAQDDTPLGVGAPTPKLVLIPAQPARKPRIPLTTAA